MPYRLIKLTISIAITFLGLTLGEGTMAQQSAPLLGGSPAMDYSRVLLQRTDVQTELGLDAQQKAGLAKVLYESAKPIIVRPVIKFQDIFQLSNEERQQWHAEIRRQAARETALVMDERRRQLEEILRPDQRKRLAELDLQWRGILALGNKSLSERLGVSAEHHRCVAQILADFEVKRLKLLSYSEKSENAASPRYQKRRELLEETEQKVLALLSDEEKSRWSRATGRAFTFAHNAREYTW